MGTEPQRSTRLDVSRRAFLGLAGATALAACSGGGSRAVRRPASPPSAPSGPAGPFNQYVTGGFAPVRREVEAQNLTVVGSIPKELRGHLLRIGPNPMQIDAANYHWFLGDGMVHSIELDRGVARSYRNRWVRTDAVAKELGEPSRVSVVAQANPIPNMANTSIVAHAGRVLALFEASLPTEITPDAATVGPFDFGGRLRSPMTAHPKVDPVTGELIFFGLDLFGPPYLRLHVVDRSGALVRSEEITLPGPSMMHDFAITEHHIVFLDMPVVYDLALVGTRPFPAVWKPEYGARIGVMPRAGTGANVRWFDIPLGYVFHIANAFDDGDQVVLDVAHYARMFDRDIHGVADVAPTFDRWTVDLRVGKVRAERLDDRGHEFPKVSPSVVGRQHRYVYLTRLDVPELGHAEFGGLVKYDARTGRSVAARLGAGRHAGEGYFVPSAPGVGEDDGWVLSIVADRANGTSELVILDATDFGGKPVARVSLPQRVPYGFHSLWVPSAVTS